MSDASAHPQRIGSYAIESELGRGGMGIVYLSRDPKLDRHVAIKVLPEVFARDQERVGRFEREAKILASLNHSNIASIHGLEEADGQRFLVLEYVEGDTLAQRVARGALPIEEALDVCRQIALALEAAHESGVVHRDLKPGNVKITPAGEVKVLDFGLAKGSDTTTASGSLDLSQSPTLAYAATSAGMILGTAGYMSPEQARGKNVDHRADIWAFGCVLFECLTGRQLFGGETISDTLAKILEREPEWEALPAGTPAVVRRVLRRCLEKDVKRRLRDVGDARLELEEALTGITSAARTPVAVRRSGGSRLAWGVAAMFAVATFALTAVLVMRPAPEATSGRFSISEPSGTSMNTAHGVSISPDGKMVMFTASDSADSYIWLRPLDALEPQRLAGTRGAYYPFWSPDSRQVGFFAGGKLKKIAVAGGSVQELSDISSGRGGAWSRSGVILFSPAADGGLFKMSANGGVAEQATFPDSMRLEVGHRWPQFLPDGKRFTFLSIPAQQGQYDIHLSSLDSREHERIMTAESAVRYIEPGYLIYGRGETLVAHRFDQRAGRVEGEPLIVADRVATGGNLGEPNGSGSVNEILCYQKEQTPNSELAFLDWEGKLGRRISLPAGQYYGVTFSPDARRVAVTRSVGAGNNDIWLVDLDREVATRFTFDDTVEDGVVWSPDGRRIIYRSNRTGTYGLYDRPASGVGEETQVFRSSNLSTSATDWSRDGKWVVIETLDADTKYDIWILPMVGGAEARPFIKTPFTERFAVFSPDGKWLAYQSNESGSPEVYIVSFPDGEVREQVSKGGGFAPLWSENGSRLYYGSPDNYLMSVTVKSSSGLVAGEPQRAFKFPDHMSGGDLLGDHIIGIFPEEGERTATVAVALDWTSSLRD